MTPTPARGRAVALVAALLLGGCDAVLPEVGDGDPTLGEAVIGPDGSLPTTSGFLPTAPAGATMAGATPASGNRWHPGVARLDRTPLRLPTDHPVRWLLAAPLAASPVDGEAGATLLVGGAGGEDGAWTAWVVTALGAGDVAGPDVGHDVQGLDDAALAGLGTPGGVPTLVAVDGAWRFADREDVAGDAPVRIFGDVRSRSRVAIHPDGAVNVDGVALAGVEALPDAVAVRAADGTVALPVDPTDRYGHAVLGDGIEAGGIRLVGGPADGTVLRPGGEGVFETRTPMWADLDGDGLDDLLATRSDDRGGARIVAHLASSGAAPFPSGRVVEGASIGLGDRWRHLVAVAPVDGGPRVVEVVTPHLSRTLTVSRLDGDTLVPTLVLDTALVTHTIGSRDLDRAAVFDADGDGLPDLVAPTRGGGLAAHALADGGDRAAGEALVADVGGDVLSNLVVQEVPFAVAPAAGRPPRLHVAHGTADAVLLYAG